MRTLVNGFRKIFAPPLLDSKTRHCISTIAYHTSLSHHGTATERSENTTSSCSTANRFMKVLTKLISLDNLCTNSQNSPFHSCTMSSIATCDNFLNSFSFRIVQMTAVERLYHFLAEDQHQLELHLNERKSMCTLQS